MLAYILIGLMSIISADDPYRYKQKSLQPSSVVRAGKGDFEEHPRRLKSDYSLSSTYDIDEISIDYDEYWYGGYYSYGYYYYDAYIIEDDYEYFEIYAVPEKNEFEDGLYEYYELYSLYSYDSSLGEITIYDYEN
jgi:hypothetical protein